VLYVKVKVPVFLKRAELTLNFLELCLKMKFVWNSESTRNGVICFIIMFGQGSLKIISKTYYGVHIGKPAVNSEFIMEYET